MRAAARQRSGSGFERQRFREPRRLREPGESLCVEAQGAILSVSGSGNRAGSGSLARAYALTPLGRFWVWAVPGTAPAPGAWRELMRWRPRGDFECERFREPRRLRQPGESLCVDAPGAILSVSGSGNRAGSGSLARAYALTPQGRFWVWAVPGTAPAPGDWREHMRWRPWGDFECERFREPRRLRETGESLCVDAPGAILSVSGSGNRAGSGSLARAYALTLQGRFWVWAVPGTAPAPGAWRELMRWRPRGDSECERFREPRRLRQPGESLCVDAPGAILSVSGSGNRAGSGSLARAYALTPQGRFLVWAVPGTTPAPAAWRELMRWRPRGDFECERFREPHRLREPGESLCVDAPGAIFECERFREPRRLRQPGESLCVDAPGAIFECERFREPARFRTESIFGYAVGAAASVHVNIATVNAP